MTPVPVEPLAPQHLLVFLVQIVVLLSLAVMLGRAAARMGLPAVVGELSAGILVGPSILGQAWPDLFRWLMPDDREQFHLLDAFGQFCVILFIGLTGTQFDLGSARRRKAVAFKVSMAGLLIPLGLGLGLGHVFPESLLPDTTDRSTFALFLGVAMSVSALPVIAKTLIDMGLLHRNIGQLTLTAGLIDDVVGWLLLSIVSIMAVSTLQGDDVARSLLYLAAFLVGAVIVGRYAMGPLLRTLLRSREPGFVAAVVVALLLAGAAVTLSLHLEAVFGAFVCGMLIKAGGAVDPSRLTGLNTLVLSVLAPIFFAMAGLRVDLIHLLDPLVLTAGLAVLAVAVIGKFAGAYLGAMLSRLNRWEALALGAGMNSRGVVQIVVAMVGLRLGVLNSEIYTIIVLVAIVTSMMAAPIIRVAAEHIDDTAEERLRKENFTGQLDQHR